MIIQFLDALAGAGKTHALALYAIQLAKAGERVLFVQPSKLLIDATMQDEFDGVHQGFSIKAIHGGKTTHVIGDIINATRSGNTKPGSILFITHEAFMRLPYIENRGDWHLLFDEVPTVDVCEQLAIPETHEMITGSLRLDPFDARYGIMTTEENATSSLAKMARNPRGDEIWERFGGLARRILSEYWDVFSLQCSYQGLVSGSQSVRSLVTHSTLKPSVFAGFKQVILASALFKESTLYKLWRAQGVEFRPVDDQMSGSLRYRLHENGGLITIRYAVDGNWSKTLRDKRIIYEGRETTIRELLPTLVGAALGEEHFAWMGNNDISDDYFGSLAATRLPNSPHGLNGYQHFHHVVVHSALNAPPAHFQFMETRDIPDEELRTANYRSAVYQAAMRISIRNPEDLTHKSITVMDSTTAHWLAELFPGSHVEILSNSGFVIPGVKAGRPRKHASDAARAQAHRRRKRDIRLLGRFCESALGRKPSFGTAYASVRDADPLLYLNATDVEEFVALLRQAHGRLVPSKEDNFLLSPAHFITDVPGCDTRRGLPNIQHVNGIWLDNDGGDLTPKMFAALFPQLRMVVWNTYSSTPECPRWRCFIPTTCEMLVEHHARIAAQIMMALRHSGFGSWATGAGSSHAALRNHGFDTGKLCATSLFYAPCQAAHPESSFFLDYRDANRSPLDVRRWLENDITAKAAEGNSEHVSGEQSWHDLLPETVEQDAPLVNLAITRWRSTPRGQGNRAFFRLACDLRQTGMPIERARHHLLAEARKARSPRERTADVAQILPRLWGRS
jgi:hypothetical protein